MLTLYLYALNENLFFFKAKISKVLVALLVFQVLIFIYVFELRALPLSKKCPATVKSSLFQNVQFSGLIVLSVYIHPFNMHYVMYIF